jgi:N-acetylglucosaminyl-diphospho-decaprenol L-rhamnosyltransferase
MDRERVTISIVSHGQHALLEQLLLDLDRLRPPAVAKLIVTLNIEEPAPRWVAWPGCAFQLLRNPRPLGFGANHNQAARHCNTEWLAILNPDLRLPADPFAPMLGAAQARDALLAPQVLDRQGHREDSGRRLLTPAQLVLRACGRGRHVPDGQIDWFAGMFLLLRRQAFESIGGFDSRFFMYVEDADLGLRLRLAGWHTRQIKDAAVLHAAQRASRRHLRPLGWHLASLYRHWTSIAFWRYLGQRQRIRQQRQADRTSRP